MTWFAAFYRESPEGKVLPVVTTLTAEQAAVMQRLAWDVVKNYPDCGLYEDGTDPGRRTGVRPAAAGAVEAIRRDAHLGDARRLVPLHARRHDAHADRGYVYCGVISVRPGMTLKAVAYKSGMADSPVAQFTK